MTNLFWTPNSEIKQWLPRLQSHRGYWLGGLPENTLRSIQKAVELGYEMIEFDVRLTGDHHVVLFHNDGLDQKLISRTSLGELRSKTEINTLEEVLEWLAGVAKKNIKYNIELKAQTIFSYELEKEVVRLVQRFNLTKQVLISCFNPLALARVRFFDATIYRALLLTFEKHPKNKWYLKRILFNIFCKPHVLHLHHLDLQRLHLTHWSREIPIVLWTVNGNLKFLSDKIHGIISDEIIPEVFDKRSV